MAEADAHVAACAACAEDVADLRTYKQTLTGAGAHWRLARRWRATPGVIAALASAAAVIALATWATVDRHPAAQPIAGRTAASHDASITLRDAGGTVTLDRAGIVVLAWKDRSRALAPDDLATVEHALTSGHLDIPAAIADLAGRSESLMGTPSPASAFAPVSPVATAVMTGLPAFAWTPLDRATRYTVRVFDDRFHQVASSGPVTGTTWAPAMPLPPGAVYAWQVTATIDGVEKTVPSAPDPPARFSVLDGADAEAIAQAKQSYAGSHLALGVLFAKAGLLDEARAELQALAAANPESALAADLLRQVQPRQRR